MEIVLSSYATRKLGMPTCILFPDLLHPHVHFELYVQGPSNEDVTSDEVLIISNLFYSPPSQPIVNHGPAQPDTAFAILPFDETMSLLSEVIETGDHQMVISMQPQYEDDKEDWLLGILLNNEEEDEAED
ncbi:hypothetical protein L226DRAFT_519380 [Lentinus tigrinus ALCF2SS1-7]|uniref:uncharacterized protein n=1 Tax=Lentinus tigrinus ALCF2SS1-7 TaxID=1328758 RepID=UPI0011660977|nr:hypothetical protein L226DRAFT_519380 [Lentinus tigrinus ALCF2SS1-7]